MPAPVNNPTVSAPSGNSTLGGFWGFLSQVAQVGAPIIQGKVNEERARSDAKVQAILNSYHQADPSLGPNNPQAAQVAANRSFLERYLPPSMLFRSDEVTGARVPSLFYYAIMGGLAIAAFLLLRRIFR